MKLKALVDTGASRSLISRSLADELGHLSRWMSLRA
ncbi:MAG: hypothetical protein DSO07_11570 [Thermoproteota archaeon]|uniref:Uncharacterized protein n=1 Tax=Candidatus Methanodesulfokora washburnensis TaxID=2478471 RepID=A0A3R9PGZ6_9CREN|nr:hypothetical protein D6D85_08810 [Candidatus Methanodesulfokores washburnensis]TDA38372.1 MAG: hypothetical protein DSO07_11570 [Candidatus Korarchaeota archaeon]